MVIVDTTVWVDYFNDVRNFQTSWMDDHFESDSIGLTDIILCEVLQGFRDDSKFYAAKELLLTLQIFHGNAELAIASAENYRRLRRTGVTIRKTVDCIIATFCVQAGYALLHNDKDFDPFEIYLGLKVIRP